MLLAKPLLTGVYSFIAHRTPPSFHRLNTLRMSTGGPALQPGRRAVLWFRNDLRLHDNHALAEAAKHGGDVLPLFVFDRRWFGATTDWGNPKTGTFRARFIHESVCDLKQRLRALGSDLHVSVGLPEEIIPQICEGCPQTVVFCHEEAAAEEQAVEKAVERALPRGAALRRVWGSQTMMDPQDLPRPPAALPDVFTKWRTDVESAQVRVRAPLQQPRAGTLPLPAQTTAGGAAFLRGCNSPVLPLSEILPRDAENNPGGASEPDARGVLAFQGGETAGLARLKHYLWDSDALKTYFDTRNGMLGADYSSKFSAWLAVGALSARTIHHECLRYERERVKNKSTYWMTFELLWRDYFRFLFVVHGSKVFHKNGAKGAPRGLRWDSGDANGIFTAWADGKTGVPLVDANMRELKATGFMSNRGRQNVASYLIHDLGVDWRRGADHFESLLIDHDVYSNTGNWHALAGLMGGRVNRFNTLKQSRDYDADGSYLRHWLPELRGLPTTHVHQPWIMSNDEQRNRNFLLGREYPAPLPTRPFEPAERMGNFRVGNGNGSGNGNGNGGDRGSRSGRGRRDDGKRRQQRR